MHLINEFFIYVLSKTLMNKGSFHSLLELFLASSGRHSYIAFVKTERHNTRRECGARLRLTKSDGGNREKKNRRFNGNDFERARHLIGVIGRPSKLHKEDPGEPKGKGPRRRGWKKRRVGGGGRGKWNPALVDRDKTSNFVSEVRRQSSRLAKS